MPGLPRGEEKSNFEEEKNKIFLAMLPPVYACMSSKNVSQCGLAVLSAIADTYIQIYFSF